MFRLTVTARYCCSQSYTENLVSLLSDYGLWSVISDRSLRPASANKNLISGMRVGSLRQCLRITV